jgi:hypothetical protein
MRAVKGRMELYFCQHHGFKHMKIMQAEGWAFLVKATRKA